MTKSSDSVAINNRGDEKRSYHANSVGITVGTERNFENFIYFKSTGCGDRAVDAASTKFTSKNIQKHLKGLVNKAFFIYPASTEIQ